MCLFPSAHLHLPHLLCLGYDCYPSLFLLTLCSSFAPCFCVSVFQQRHTSQTMVVEAWPCCHAPRSRHPQSTKALGASRARLVSSATSSTLIMCTIRNVARVALLAPTPLHADCGAGKLNVLQGDIHSKQEQIFNEVQSLRHRGDIAPAWVAFASHRHS